jgi:hypothetical protein
MRMITTRRRLVRHVENGDIRNAYRLLVGNLEVKKPLGRPRRRWVDNIKMCLGEIGCGGMYWISLAKDRD